MNNFNFIQQFLEFQKQFKGNPQEQVQELLRSGKVSKEQYDNAVQMVNQLKGIFNVH